MSKIENKCLLLNADYSPICLVSYKKAIIWSVKAKNNTNYSIEIISYIDNKYMLGAENRTYPLPVIARLKKFINLRYNKVKFSRNNVFLRDNYTCQYCGIKFNKNQLTYDHVIPKSYFNKDGNNNKTYWHNVVACCLSCNIKKGNRTPDQANMNLVNIPVEPTDKNKYLPIARDLSIISEEMPESWKQFINPKLYSYANL